MISRRSFLGAAVSLAAIISAGPVALAQDKIDVVASFSILADMAKQVGGDRVNVAAFVGPNGDPHVYEPTPADAKALSEARLLILNGMAFEGWLPRLVQASNFSGVQLVASAGIVPLRWEEGGDGHDEHTEDHHDDHDEDREAHHEDHDDHDKEKKTAESHEHDHEEGEHHHGVYDPHAWQSLANGVIYVRNIADALAKLDPDHAQGYQDRAAAYIAELEALDEKLKASFADLPANRRKIITSHDAFRYFGEAYGVSFMSPAGLSTDAEPSAGDIARIINRIREQKLTAVFVENVTNDRLLKQIARETDVSIGGKLYSGALSEVNGPAPSYIKMFEHNAAQLLSALAGS